MNNSSCELLIMGAMLQTITQQYHVTILNILLNKCIILRNENVSLDDE